MAWKLYKGNQWWKLAGYMLLVTTVILVTVLFGFVWDWHDIGGRPANLPPDVGTYITNNELVGILILLWVIVAPILSCVISYITKLIVKYHGEKLVIRKVVMGLASIQKPYPILSNWFLSIVVSILIV